jgi:hypothetical protein
MHLNIPSPSSQYSSICFEGPSSAFRNYGIYNHTLVHEDSAESQLVNPSSLLFDGSIVDASDATNFRIGVSTVPVTTTLELQDGSSPTTPLLESELATSQPPLRSSIPSLRALENRLSQCSISIIRHVHSVLRYSSTISWTFSLSWRSSWLSFDSSMEALASVGPASLTDEGTVPSTNLDTSISKSRLSKLFLRRTKHTPLRALKKTPDSLPLDEKLIWHELMDENQLSIWSGRPIIAPMSLKARNCDQYHCKIAVYLYGFAAQEICRYCGFLPVHSFAMTFEKPDVLKC